MSTPMKTFYDIRGKDLAGIASNMLIIVSVTWLALALGIVQVLANADKTGAFLMILFGGIIINAVQLFVLFLYILGYLMTTGKVVPESEDEQQSKDL